jgi:hypothetical protein
MRKSLKRILERLRAATNGNLQRGGIRRGQQAPLRMQRLEPARLRSRR